MSTMVQSNFLVVKAQPPRSRPATAALNRRRTIESRDEMISRSVLSLTLLLCLFLVRSNGWVAAPVPIAFGRSAQLHLSDPEEGDDYGYDEETTRNPTEEVAKIKQKIEEAKEAGDMDTVMTLMGTLLALGGGYDSEVSSSYP